MEDEKTEHVVYLRRITNVLRGWGGMCQIETNWVIWRGRGG